MATNLQLNQRIVYAGLVRTSEDRNIVKSAFAHWNKGASDSPLDIFKVVDELVAYLGLDAGEKKALMIGMHAASGQLHDDLKPVPTYVLDGGQSGDSDDQDTNETSEQKQRAPHLEITASYLQQVSLRVKRNDPQSHKELVRAVSTEGLSVMPKVVDEWASGGLNIIDFPSSTTVQHCQDLAHEFYVMVCDFIGPVESDTIINQVISELSATEASRKFNPQDLL